MLNHGVVENSQISFFKSLKSCIVPVFLATLVYRVADQYTTKEIENLVRSSEGINSSIVFWISISLIGSIIFPLLTTLICTYALKKNTLKNFTSFFNDFFELSLLENLRSWGKSFLWGLLFIIPGIVKMGYYFLVTYVVLLNPQYARGEVDALKLSEKISKKHIMKLSFLLLIFFFIIPGFTSTVFDHWLSFDQHYYTATLYCVFEATMVLLFNYYILKYFMNEIYFGDSSPHSENNQLNSMKGTLNVTSI